MCVYIYIYLLPLSRGVAGCLPLRSQVDPWTPPRAAPPPRSTAPGRGERPPGSAPPPLRGAAPPGLRVGRREAGEVSARRRAPPRDCGQGRTWPRAVLGELTPPPPAEQPGFGHEEETEEVSANDAALHRGSDFPARHWPLVSVQGEAPGEAARSRRAAGRCEAARERSPTPGRRAAAAPRARPRLCPWGAAGPGGCRGAERERQHVCLSYRRAGERKLWEQLSLPGWASPGRARGEPAQRLPLKLGGRGVSALVSWGWC